MQIKVEKTDPLTISDNQIMISTVVRGDIIRCDDFENLLFKDMFELDAACGFYVNPWTRTKNWDNTVFKVLYSPGKIKRPSPLPGRKTHIMCDYKQKIPRDSHFVVIFTQPDVAHPKEYIDEDDCNGHYPLLVIAKMLGPDDEYDVNGIEITFHMESEVAPYSVLEVESLSCMIITFKPL